MQLCGSLSILWHCLSLGLEWKLTFSRHCGIWSQVGLRKHHYEQRTSRYSSWIYKRQKNQRSNCQHLLDHLKSKRIPEKHLLLLHCLHQSLWLCGSQQTVENSERDGNTRPPASWEISMQVRKQQLELDMEQQTGCKRERSMSKLYNVTLLI